MTLAGTLATTALSEAISEGDGAFMHGPTFMANPLACAVAGASIELLLSSDWGSTVARIEQQLASGLESCRDFEQVVDVRVLGAIGVVRTQRTCGHAGHAARVRRARCLGQAVPRILST